MHFFSIKKAARRTNLGTSMANGGSEKAGGGLFAGLSTTPSLGFGGTGVAMTSSLGRAPLSSIGGQKPLGIDCKYHMYVFHCALSHKPSTIKIIHIKLDFLGFHESCPLQSCLAVLHTS